MLIKQTVVILAKLREGIFMLHNFPDFPDSTIAVVPSTFFPKLWIPHLKYNFFWGGELLVCQLSRRILPKIFQSLENKGPFPDKSTPLDGSQHTKVLATILFASEVNPTIHWAKMEWLHQLQNHRYSPVPSSPRTSILNNRKSGAEGWRERSQ